MRGRQRYYTDWGLLQITFPYVPQELKWIEYCFITFHKNSSKIEILFILGWTLNMCPRVSCSEKV